MCLPYERPRRLPVTWVRHQGSLTRQRGRTRRRRGGGGGCWRPEAGGLTSDCHAAPRNPKGPPKRFHSPQGKADRTPALLGFSPTAINPKRNRSEEQSLTRPGLTCQERRGRRHLVPERETRALGSEFTRAKPGPYTSPRAWKPRGAASGITRLRGRFTSGGGERKAKAPEGARAAPGPRFKERRAGRGGARGGGRGARGAGRGVRLRPRQAEPALPRGGARAVLTLAAEPEVVRGCGQRWPVVAFPSSRAPRSRRPAVCGPRAPASRPPGPASPGLPRSARPRPGGRSQRPGLRASSLRRPEGRRAGGRRAGEPDGGWGRWRRREHGRQAANPHGQREAQQEHHPARQRRQDLEERSRREGVRRTLVIGPLHFCCLWFCNFPDYSKYQDGHVK